MTSVQENINKKLDWLSQASKGTFVEFLGLSYREVALDKIEAEFSIGNNFKQPFGLMHGGISASISETVCSLGAWINVKDADVVGIELNINHLKSASSGIGIAIASPIFKGSRQHVWEAKIFTALDGSNGISAKERSLIAVSRCTLSVLNKGS